MKLLLLIVLLVGVSDANGGILIQGKEMDLGNPNITSEQTPKSIRVSVDGGIALVTEVQVSEKKNSMVYVDGVIIGVVKSAGKPGCYEHNVNFRPGNYLIQVVTANDKTYIAVRGVGDEKLLRVLCLDKNMALAEVLK